MKKYKVVVRIPSYVEKTIYVDDANSKTDARRKVKNSLFGDDWGYDMSGDEELGQFWSQAKILSVKEGE